MPFLAQTAGLCRGKETSVFSDTRGSGMVMLQGIEDARGSRGEGDGYLHWEARDEVGQGLCMVPGHPDSDQDLEGNVISAILS